MSGEESRALRSLGAGVGALCIHEDMKWGWVLRSDFSEELDICCRSQHVIYKENWAKKAVFLRGFMEDVVQSTQIQQQDWNSEGKFKRLIIVLKLEHRPESTGGACENTSSLVQTKHCLLDFKQKLRDRGWEFSFFPSP